MILALLSQPGLDKGWIEPLQPIFGIKLIKLVLDEPLTGFAFHIFCGVRHVALSEPVVREQIVQMNSDLASRAVLFKRRASVPLITGDWRSARMEASLR